MADTHRASESSQFSERYSGSILTGYCRTADLEKRDSELDLATAMAISGAALSTHTGTLKRQRILRLVLTLTRLGYWTGNPRCEPETSGPQHPGIREFLLDLLGRSDARLETY